jgi:hypothetical protein
MENKSLKPDPDKLHTKSLNDATKEENLAFDKDKKSFEFDVNSADEDYDHPSDYETVSEGAIDDDSTYDNSNPYVGDEYASKKEIADDELLESGMHLDKGESVRLSIEDKILSKTPEDDRDDLDEEGYPVNDEPKK